MTAPQRVAILGLGLIGASLGLALKRLPKPPTVVGFDLNGSQVRAAQSMHSIDRAAGGLLDAVQDAELVVVASPVRAVEPILRQVGNLLVEGTVVTDTASTKSQVLEWAERLLPRRVGFVGGHPMTGKVTANVNGPDGGLFAGRVYCLTPSPQTDPRVVARAVWLVEAVGGVPYFLNAEEHDTLLAAVSHLPYVLSATLMDDVAGNEAWREMSALAAGGLIAATGLAEGDARVFGDICLTNRGPLVAALDRYLEHLQAVRDQVADGDEGLIHRFDRAHKRRAEWLESRARPPADLPELDLKPSNPFLPSKLGGFLRGRRP